MKKQFNLSEEMQDYAHDSFRLDDVKKFIKLLKKAIKTHSKMHWHKGNTCWQQIRDDLNELAGEKFK